MADSYDEARDVLSGFIQTTWDTATSSALLLYQNIEGDRPLEPTLFGRLTIQFVTGTRADVSGLRFRREGLMTVQVFVPQGSGTEQAEQTAEALVEALEGVGPATLENVWLRDIGMREVGSDGTYYQVNVEAEFTFDRVA